jgi:hypothetical protein
MMDKTHPIAGPDTSKHPFTLICVYESLGMSQPSFDPGQSKKKGGERDEGQEKGHGQASQTAGSKVLGDDAGCPLNLASDVSSGRVERTHDCQFDNEAT